MPPMLNEDIQKQVVEFFQSMKEPVVIVFFGDQDGNCEYCGPTLQLLMEITSLSNLLSLEIYDLVENAELAARYHMDKAPGFLLAGKRDDQLVDYGIRYAGIPAGHEFSSLINDLILVSKRDSGLQTATREFLHSLQQPVHLQVFVTPSCPYCPRAVILAHQMAMESELVQAEMVEATEFPQLAERFGVNGVPHTSINQGAGELVGAAPEALLVEQIKMALTVQD